MKMGKLYITAALAVLLTIAFAAGSADKQSTDSLQLKWFGTSTLQDVQAVYPQVSLEVADANTSEPNFVSQIGPLTQRSLQNILTQMLKSSGIPITNKFNAASANAPLSLNITVFARALPNTAQPAYAAFVYTEAMQPETLIRDGKIRSFSRTWPMVPTGSATRALLFVTSETIVKDITDEVTRQVRSFLIDYSAANLSKKPNVPALKPPAEKKPEQKPAQKQPAPAAQPRAI